MPAWLLALALVAVGEDPAAAVLAREDAAFEAARAGEVTRSTELLIGLQREFPGSERACLWQERVFLNATALGDPPAMWRAAEAIVARNREMRASGRTGTLARVCRKDATSTLIYLATRWHREADDECDEQRFDLAERAYRTFLAEFLGDPEAYEMQFFLAELLLARSSFALRRPGSPCHALTCGNAVRAEEEARRRRGEPRPRCGPFKPIPGEPASCPWLRAAQIEYLITLERDPDGRYKLEAVHEQLQIARILSDHDERERTRMCRTNPEGDCIAGVEPRGPACFEPTAACHAHLGRRERWPSTALFGVAPVRPPLRAP